MLATRVEHPIGHERSALRHGAWRAIAHTARGDLDQALDTTRRILPLAPGLTSAHCRHLLAKLHTDLTTHGHRTTDVGLVCEELALATRR